MNAQEAANLAATARESGPMLMKLATRILRDRQMAEDVCQQALLKAWEQRDSIDRLSHWLRRVVVNECFSILRRRKVEREARPTMAMAQQQAVDPTELTAHKESVLLALAELPEGTRDVVVLRLMDGRSGNEVSEMLQCSASEVSRRLHRGVEQLRSLLAQEYV